MTSGRFSAPLVRAAASICAAMGPFMSQLPRPYSVRPSRSGRAVARFSFCHGTVSMCPARISPAAPSPPKRATRLRCATPPHSPSCARTTAPRPFNSLARVSAIPTVEQPGAVSIDTSFSVNATTSRIAAILAIALGRAVPDRRARGCDRGVDTLP